MRISKSGKINVYGSTIDAPTLEEQFGSLSAVLEKSASRQGNKIVAPISSRAWCIENEPLNPTQLVLIFLRMIIKSHLCLFFIYFFS